MLPVLTSPWALLGLLAVPALVAVYFFKNRYREYVVSSLMLWADPSTPKLGGRRVDRLQTPPTFWLELALLTLLALAAAGPMVHRVQGARPLVVVLDDSFSMLAGGDDSARGRARLAVEQELRSNPPFSVRFVLAGERPATLGEAVRTPAEASRLLADWKCQAPAARLDDAVTLAADLAGEWGRLLVVTDRPPADEVGKGKLQWWAFGRVLPNAAFVNAARSSRDGADRVLLEVANLSANPQTTTLTLSTGDPPAESRREAVAVGPNETRRVVFELPEGTPVLRAALGDDGLALDNRVTLHPNAPRPVRVDLAIDDPVLKRLTERAVRSVPSATVSPTLPDLLITDKQGTPAGDAWTAVVLAEKDADAFTGPFVLDRAHPLTEGLGLTGVIWGAGKSDDLGGTPVVMAGNVPLVTDVEHPSGRHDVKLRLRPDLSTVHETPNWPVMVYNLLAWRGSLAPGLSRPNLRLGEEATLTFAVPRESVRLVAPGGGERTLPVQGRRVVVRPGEAGEYVLAAGEQTYPLAVNALSRDESDLSGRDSGRWGDWLDEKTLRLEYVDASWLLVLAALAVGAAHLWVLARGPGRAGA